MNKSLKKLRTEKLREVFIKNVTLDTSNSESTESFQCLCFLSQSTCAHTNIHTHKELAMLPLLRAYG